MATSVQVVDDHLPEPFDGELGSYALIVRLRASPGRGDGLHQLLLAGVEPTRSEPGCVTYFLNRDRQDRNLFYFYEAYTNLAAFRMHLETTHIKSMLGKIPPYLAEDNQMTFLTVSEADDRTAPSA